MDYNFWDDRTNGLEINPCKGCEDYQNGKCVSSGGCISENVECKYKTNNWLKHHHKPMRRKPFKIRVSYLLDEFHNIGKIF